MCQTLQRSLGEIQARCYANDGMRQHVLEKGYRELHYFKRVHGERSTSELSACEQHTILTLDGKNPRILIKPSISS